MKPKIILSDIGMINETDVSLAKASEAIIIGYNIHGWDELFMFERGQELKCMREFSKLSRNNYLCNSQVWTSPPGWTMVKCRRRWWWWWHCGYHSNKHVAQRTPEA